MRRCLVSRVVFLELLLVLVFLGRLQHQQEQPAAWGAAAARSFRAVSRRRPTSFNFALRDEFRPVLSVRSPNPSSSFRRRRHVPVSRRNPFSSLTLISFSVPAFLTLLWFRLMFSPRKTQGATEEPLLDGSGSPAESPPPLSLQVPVGASPWAPETPEAPGTPGETPLSALLLDEGPLWPPPGEPFGELPGGAPAGAPRPLGDLGLFEETGEKTEREEPEEGEAPAPTPPSLESAGTLWHLNLPLEIEGWSSDEEEDGDEPFETEGTEETETEQTVGASEAGETDETEETGETEEIEETEGIEETEDTDIFGQTVESDAVPSVLEEVESNREKFKNLLSFKRRRRRPGDSSGAEGGAPSSVEETAGRGAPGSEKEIEGAPGPSPSVRTGDTEGPTGPPGGPAGGPERASRAPLESKGKRKKFKVPPSVAGCVSWKPSGDRVKDAALMLYLWGQKGVKQVALLEMESPTKVKALMQLLEEGISLRDRAEEILEKEKEKGEGDDRVVELKKQFERFISTFELVISTLEESFIWNYVNLEQELRWNTEDLVKALQRGPHAGETSEQRSRWRKWLKKKKPRNATPLNAFDVILQMTATAEVVRRAQQVCRKGDPLAHLGLESSTLSEALKALKGLTQEAVDVLHDGVGDYEKEIKELAAGPDIAALLGGK